MLKRENHIEIDRRKFYKTVLALVVPMALQNLINVGVTAADVIMLGAGQRRYPRWRGCQCGWTDSVYYDIVPVRSDLRSDGAHGSVLGKRRPGCD
mgnify:CR=1 FL=1